MTNEDLTPLPVGLYLHIPFCLRRCGYCAFISSTGNGRKIFERYTDSLATEMESWQGKVRAKSVFFGGGTPTILPIDLLDRLVKAVRESFNPMLEAEWTIEGHPSTLDDGKLACLVKLGFNRLSLGIESFNPETLKRLNRGYDPDHAGRIVSQARKAGFRNINFDIVLGWPWETDGQYQNSIKAAMELAPEHLSVYSLKIEEGTPFKRLGLTVDSDRQAGQYLWTHSFLEDHGFRHYEIANYARPGFEARHNIFYWHYDDYLGVGVSAASKIGRRSFSNTKSLKRYLALAGAGKPAVGKQERLSDREIIKRKAILRLRLKQGVRRGELNGMIADDIVESFKRLGYLRCKGDYIQMTAQGWLVSNQIFIQFE
ncbi:MAG: radical SAM family heme chaperone HemW [Elusimicrobia bacterium]|nr:radical SAM family heme chaperone HemW [Elusimicrobiota bacterium]